MQVEDGDLKKQKKKKKKGEIKTTRKTYHSPPVGLVEESLVLPAAAEAKLDGSGVGIFEIMYAVKQ